MARRRLADGVQLVREFVGIQDAAAAALGHAVILRQAARPALEDLRLERRAERCAGAELHAEAREIEAAELRQIHDALILHWHEHRVRRAMLLRQLQELQRVELRHQHDGAAARQRREEAHQRRVRVQRRGADRDRGPVIARERRAVHVRPAHAMRLHDSLGTAGRARRVDDVERRIGIDVHGPRLRIRGREPAAHRDRHTPQRPRATAWPSSAAAIGSSRNRIFAPQSDSIVANASGVDEGASGATATPARSAPRNIAPYSTHDAAQIEMTSPACTPSRCNEAATRSINWSSSPYVSTRAS